MPTLVLFILVSYIDKVNKLCFKRKMGIKPNIGKLE